MYIRIISPILILTFASHATADRIVFHNGRIMDGIIESREDGRTVVRDGATRITVSDASIARIIPGTEGDHLLIESRALLATQPADALVKLTEAVRRGAHAELLAEVILNYATPLEAAVLTLSPADRAALNLVLEPLERDIREPGPELVLLLIRWHVLLGNAEVVQRLMREMGRDRPDLLDANREEVLARLSDRIRHDLEVGDFSVALGMLIAMRQLDPDQAAARRTEMILLWARREREKSDFEKALRIYVDQLMDEYPNIARERIAYTLTEAETRWRAEGREREVILLYESFGLPHAPELARERLIELWKEIGWRAVAAGDVNAARRHFGQCELLSAGSALPDLAFCEFVDMRDRLDPRDFAGHFSLGEWCERRGLVREARQMYEVAGKSELLRDFAVERMAAIDDQNGRRELERLLALYEKGRYAEVLEGVLNLKSGPLGVDVRKQADSLQGLTETAIRIATAEHPQQAEVLWQQAERAWYLGELLTARDLIHTLTERYADTPAAARARELLEKLEPRMDLNILERRRQAEADRRFLEEIDADDERKSAIAEEIRSLRKNLSRSEEERRDDE